MPNKRFIFEVPVECAVYPPDDYTCEKPEDRTANPAYWAKQVIDQVLLDAIRLASSRQFDMIKVNNGATPNSGDCEQALTDVYDMYKGRQMMLEKMRKEVRLSRIEECVEWTDAKPTTEGWYWWKETPESIDKYAAHVYRNAKGELEAECLVHFVDTLEDAKEYWHDWHCGAGVVDLKGVWSVAEKG